MTSCDQITIDDDFIKENTELVYIVMDNCA